jgi:glycerol-3-phosphate dehydrogenase subunit C
MVCPAGVKIAEINARARNNIVITGAVPWRQRVRNNLLGRPELVGKLGQPVSSLANVALQFRVGRVLTETVLGIARDAPFPKFAGQRFSRWFRDRTRSAGADAKVVFFHGCSTEYYEPRVGKAAVHVLEANGFDVLVPPQNCCGLPLLSNGEFKPARRYHESNVSKLVDYARQGYAIVGTSTSCTLTLKEEAPELLDHFSEEARLLATHTFDIHEFLLERHFEGMMRAPSRPIPLTLAYHAPCQYRAHRIGIPSLEIMKLIPELQIIESQQACCGIAGTYGYKSEKYPIAMAVGRPLFDFVMHVGGRAALCDSETCRWQITHGTDIPSFHPVELLAAAYGYEVEGALAELIGNSVET